MKTIIQHRDNISYWALLLIIACLALSAYGKNAAAAGSSDSESPYFIQGYDVVSYFQASGPLPGNRNFKTVYDGQTMLFISQANLNEFLAYPDTYLPAYNGHCAYGMVYGMKSKIDPLQYDIVDGRLYLQLDGGTKRRWSRRISSNIRRGDKAWDKLATTSDDN